ncbi:MAG TPA: cyclic nucleotide-binding domain-containing protein, partial [Pyrinomonadaceae bacterium]
LAERSTVRTVGQLGPADFFGEMSLLTGEPRTANVVTDEETEVLQIRKTAIKSLFEANPPLLESISKIVAERREVLSEKELEQTMHPTKEHTGMISAIRKFFGLKEND